MEVGTMDITEIFELYPTQADCILHLEDVRWQGKPPNVFQVVPIARAAGNENFLKEFRLLV